jgi:hypothetical protein
MQQKRTQKTGRGKKPASREPQMTRSAEASTSPKTPSTSQTSREQASKAADAGAAPEQLDAEPE